MSYLVIVLPIVSFALFFLAQLVLVRCFTPRSQDRFIFLLYLLIPLLIFFVAWGFRFFGLLSTSDALLSYLLFFVIASSWVASYPAVYASCPTLMMSYIIDKSPGIRSSELITLLDIKQSSTERIDDAVHNKWIVREGASVRLSRFGWLFLQFFSIYRRILGRSLKTT